MKVLVLFDLARPTDPDETFASLVPEEKEDKPTEADIIRCLQRLGHELQTLAVFEDVGAIVEKVKTYQPDVVFNLIESFHQDRSYEPNIPALLELLKVPYTGAGPEALVLCKDKALAKKVLSYHHMRMARFVVSHRKRPLKRLRRFVFPAFVKPASQESSDGISQASFARNEEETLERARFVHEKLGCDALIEEYIEGRELYASVLGGRRLTVFPPREIFFEQMPEDAPKFATFKAKWDEAYREKWGIRNGPAGPLPEGVERRLAMMARKVYQVLKIRGQGRLDVRLAPDGELVFMEANPNPSLGHDEDFAQAAIAAGVSYDQLIQTILEAART